jgi:predicted  nucleic acid-binding Zn-ribbon protein
MALTVTELADEVRETNRHLADAIDALRNEISALKAEVGKINTNMGWVKKIGGSFAAIMTTAIFALLGVAYQAGGRLATIESSVSALEKSNAAQQKATEELRADFKARDKLIADTVADTRKITEEVRLAIKGQSADMSRIQESLDRITDGISKVIMRPRQP